MHIAQGRVQDFKSGGLLYLRTPFMSGWGGFVIGYLLLLLFGVVQNLSAQPLYPPMDIFIPIGFDPISQ